MEAHGVPRDPYSHVRFWLDQLGGRPVTEMEAWLQDFDAFLRQVERDYRIAMTAHRAAVLREAVLELVRSGRRQATDRRQGDLFES